MVLFVRQLAAGADKEFLAGSPSGGAPEIVGDEQVPVVALFRGAFGTFKAATRTTAGTTEITSPGIGGSLILTDLMVTGEKQAGSSVEVRFTDGTNTVTLYLASQVDAPASTAISFSGRWQGWKDARLDMITVGTADATVAVGYIKVPGGLEFAEWNALR